MSDRLYSSTEVARAIHNALMAAKSPETLPIPPSRMRRLMLFAQAFLDVPQQLIVERAITVEEMVCAFIGAAALLQTQASSSTPKAIRDYLNQLEKGVDDTV